MSTPETEVRVKITGRTTDATESLKDLVQGFKDLGKEARAAMESTAQSSEKVSDSINSIGSAAGWALAASGASILVQALSGLSQQAAQLRSESAVLDLSVEQYQGMAAAATAAGIGQDKLFTAVERIAGVMREAREGSSSALDQLFKLGITTKQVGDASFRTADVMMYLSGRLRDGATATQTLAGLTDLLGGRSATASLGIKQIGSSNAELSDRTREANALTEEQTRRLAEMGIGAAQAGTWLKNFAVKGLIELADAFRESGQAQQEAFGGGGTAEMMDRLEQEANRAASKGPGKRNRGDASVAAREDLRVQMESIKDQLEAVKSGSAQKLQLLKDYAAAALEYYGKSDVNAVRAANRDVIAETRRFNEEQQRVRKEADSQEARDTEKQHRVWMSGMRDGLSKMKDVEADLTKIIADRQAEEQAASAARRDLALEDVAFAEQEAGAMAAAGLISRQQELERLREFEQQRYEINVAALREKLALLDIGTAAYAQAIGQLELLDSQHMRRVRALDLEGLNERQRAWSTMAQNIGDSMQPVLARLLNFTLAAKGFVVQMAAAIGDSFASMAARNISTMLMQAAVGKTIRMKEIAGDAKAAAAGAYKAVVGIPYVGPFLAPAAAAAAFGATMAFASAEGGYDIPAGVNPLVQAHAREMILPAEHADTIRRMGARAGGDAGGGDGDGGRHVTINNNITAMDSRDVARALSRSNGSATAAGMRAYARSRGFGLP